MKRILGLLAASILSVSVLWSESHRAMALGSATACGTSDALTTTELLQDPRMVNGLQYGQGTVQNSAWHPNRASQCVAQYQAKGIVDSKWKFIEVCEDTCFCDNPVNPVMVAGRIDYGNNYKSVSIDNGSGVTTLSIDTSREWREGCALNLPVRGISPDYAHENAAWNWNHLLIHQDLDLSINDYDQLEFSGDFKLASSSKTGTECPAGDTTGDSNSFDSQALVYLAIAFDTGGMRPVKGFGLIRLWATSDGTNWRVGDVGPTSGGDPRGDYVYIARSDDVLGNYRLSSGSPHYQTYHVDLRRLARETLRGREQMLGKSADYSHYRITAVYFGTEIWGSYGLTLKVKNLSLKGRNYSEHACVSWNRYWNPSITDHLYGKEICSSTTSSCFAPKPSGWNSEGRVAATPTVQLNGSIPLYRYWNPAIGDHFYSTGLWPFGAGCTGGSPCGAGPWLYEGVSAYVWPTQSAGNDRVPIYEFWNAISGDHLYSADPTDGNLSVPFAGGYLCSAPPGCNVPMFYMSP